MSGNRFSNGMRRLLSRRRASDTRAAYRRARLEFLEPRLVLAAPTLASIADVTLLAGAPLNIALQASDADQEILHYTVTSSDPGVVPTIVDPFYNMSIRISVKYTGSTATTADDFEGDMVFQLFEEWAPNTTARILELINFGGPDGTPFYDGIIFHRINSDVIQAGDPEGTGLGGSDVTIDDEFTPELQYTSKGVLGMARTKYSDTGDSQFFITSGPARMWDLNYTIFGFLTQGEDIRQKIAAVPRKTDDTDTTNNEQPKYPVQIVSITPEIDFEHPVLHLSAAPGTTGEVTITVTASDLNPDSAPAVRQFKATVQADTFNNDPFLGPIDPIETEANTPVVDFQIPAIDVEGDAILYGAIVDPAATNVTVNVNSTTGKVTITPSNGVAGVVNLTFGVYRPNWGSVPDAVPWDTQVVPLLIRPAAPTVTLAPASDTGAIDSDGVTNLNNTPGKQLTFTVTGTVSGALVEVLAGGVVIGSATATGSTTTVTTTGAYTLAEGSNSIIARQTLLDQEIDAGNLEDVVDLQSDDSLPRYLFVDTGTPQITSTDVTEAVEGQPYSYDVQSDAEGGTTRYQLTLKPTGMTIDLVTGVIAWDPVASEGSGVPVTVRVADLAGNFAERSFSISVQPVNSTPVANGRTVTVPQDTPTNITLTAQDGDPEVQQALLFEIVTPPEHGQVVVLDAATGAVRYTPDAQYFGLDSFTFKVTDDASAGDPPTLTSDPATVSIEVVRVNNAPIANTQSASTAEDTSVSLTLTGEDGDPEVEQVLTFEIVLHPAHGTLVDFNPATGAVTYQPALNYWGVDGFQFRVRDDATAGDPASLPSTAVPVTITVTAVNDAPVAHAQDVAAVSNFPQSITLTGSDGDPDFEQPLTFTLVEGQGPQHGTISGFDPATGTLVYTPATDYRGPDSFWFFVTDDATAGGPALASTPVEVSILVSVVNLLPSANAQGVTTAEDTALPITLTGDDGNTEMVQVLTFAIVQQPAHGTLSGFNAATGAVIYTPAAGYNGTDTFTFQVTDDDQGEGPPLVSAPAAVTITVTAVNDPPTAQDISVSTPQDTPRTIALVGSDGDPDKTQVLTFVIVSGPSHGTLSGPDPATGAVIYTPAALYHGSDSFTYKVIDDDQAGGAALESAAATVSIQVAPVNNRPVANPQTLTTAEDTSLALTLTGDDADPEVEQTLRFAVVSGPSHGTLINVNPNTGAATYVPGPDFNGSDSFSFTVTDDAQAGAPAALTSPAALVSITVTAVDDAPRFSALGPQTVFQTQPLAATVRAIDPDLADTAIRYALESGAPDGMRIDAITGEINWLVPEDFPVGALPVQVRATEWSAAGQPGLSAVQVVEIFVEDIRLAMIASLLGDIVGNGFGPASSASGNGAIGGAALPAPAPAFPGPASGAAGDPGALPSIDAALFDEFSSANLLDPQVFPGLRLGPDTGLGRGLLPGQIPESGPEEGQQTPASPSSGQAPQGTPVGPQQRPGPGVQGEKSDVQGGTRGQTVQSPPTATDLALADAEGWIAADLAAEAVAAGEVVAAEERTDL